MSERQWIAEGYNEDGMWLTVWCRSREEARKLARTLKRDGRQGKVRKVLFRSASMK
jgi:hypothetical protein